MALHAVSVDSGGEGVRSLFPTQLQYGIKCYHFTQELSCGKGGCACVFVGPRDTNIPFRRQKSRTACKGWIPLSLQMFLLPVVPCWHSGV